MKTTRIMKCVAAALVVAGACAAYRAFVQRKGTNVAPVAAGACAADAQETAPDRVKEILALAKQSAEDGLNVNFCGFFVGMSRHDAIALAEHYRLKDGEYSMDAAPGKAVSRLWFSLRGVRRVTRGGNTLEEVAQAVANRVGDLKHYRLKGLYERKTIDGVVLSLHDGGLVIQNGGVASQKPLATAEAAQKDKADAANPIPLLFVRDMVAIPGKDFKMGKYEVTQAQWQAIMGDNPSRFKGDNNPVECVSWDDCQKFIEKLNARPDVKASGLTFRLPTEAEWEYACRAGSTGDYCKSAAGTEITEDTLGEVAWYCDNSGDRAHPVGQKKPNAFGLYDMNGNVLEWCENRVSRGGSWCNSSGDCTAGDRLNCDPDDRYHDLGFRLAASQE